jgi:hypothetical protein
LFDTLFDTLFDNLLDTLLDNLFDSGVGFIASSSAESIALVAMQVT